MGTPMVRGLRDPEHRIQQICHVCNVWDDHPRHHYMGPGPDGTGMVDQSRHMDCCASAGCPDGTCERILADAGDKKGMDLVAHLREMPPGAHVVMPEEAPAATATPAPRGRRP